MDVTLGAIETVVSDIYKTRYAERTSNLFVQVFQWHVDPDDVFT